MHLAVVVWLSCVAIVVCSTSRVELERSEPARIHSEHVERVQQNGQVRDKRGIGLGLGAAGLAGIAGAGLVGAGILGAGAAGAGLLGAGIVGKGIGYGIGRSFGGDYHHYHHYDVPVYHHYGGYGGYGGGFGFGYGGGYGYGR